MGLRSFLYFFLQPWIFLCLATLHLPLTWLAIIRSGDYGALLSPSRFKEKWFAVLWLTAGPLVRAESEPRVKPLLEGRVLRGCITKSAASTPLKGSVMEIGAGSGMWAHLFTSKTVDAVYAIEPNMQQHPALLKRAEELGIRDKYHVVGKGVQDLKEGEQPQVDNIVTIFCFCSIPDPAENAKAVYKFLKPGGRWYVYEHVAAHPKQGDFMRSYQKMINTIWPQFFNGCSLCRDTGRTIEQAGDWAHVDLAMPVDEGWYAGIPHTIGILTKPGTMNG
ncbi:hypothetical protein A1Q2_02348 [Trichosporon asahii var. asahii CBS 8904]|uniref:Methyltransferase type 11 domain-containing protein n=1 Tax=Trichosporon asahii var. asahii (strain CBS 8904) TaxID=1220162 RepID=K1W3A0_TRIAC|nr:hypothetical protein A1Q2_02348 [Trichosporon asahii var. asahii CBS 8904]